MASRIPLPVVEVARQSVNHTVQPPLPIGTRGDGQRLEPAPGRYTVVQAEGRNYLYVPEVQALYSVSEAVASFLDQVAAMPSNDPELARLATTLTLGLVEQEQHGLLSEQRHAHQGLRDVVVHVSQVCNLDCVYCYATELNKVNKFMTDETADRVVEHTMAMALSQGAGLGSVKFLGGEPTLAWPLMERMMAAYTLASERASVSPPRFTAVTNGTRITDKMAASAARWGMYLLVSIDGPAEIHDQLRPTKTGGPSHHLAAEALRTLVEAGVDTAVESVYTRQHYEDGITPQAMIDHFLELGIREFQIQPTVGLWHGHDTIDQINDVTGWFAEAARGSVRSFRTDAPYLLRGIQFVFDGFALRERRRYVCGAGRTFIGINYDGQAFPCYLLQSPHTSYGFIGGDWNQGRYEELRTAFTRNGKEYHPICRGCWANEICQSCLGTSWQIAPEITKPPAWFCFFQKSLIGATLAEIAAARDSADWDRFLANMKRYLAPLNAPA